MKARGRSAFFRAFLLYGSTRATTEAFLSARGLVLATLLGPEGFGAWTLFRLAIRWAAFASLGVARGLELTVAQAGPDGHDRSAPAARTTLGFMLLAFGLLSVVVLAVSFVQTDPLTALWLRATAAVLVTENVAAYGLVMIRARGELRRYGVSETAFAATHFVLATALALRWDLAGAFVGFALASVTGLLWLLRGAPRLPRLDPVQLRSLLTVGFPLGFNLMLGTALGTADRLIVGAMAGPRVLGWYAFGVAVSGLGASLAWVIRTVVFPEIYRDAKLDGAATALRSHFKKKIIPLAWTLPVLLGAAAILLAPAVELLLPAYSEAAPVARWMVLTGATATLSSLGAIGATAAGRQRAVPAFTGGALALNVAISFLALSRGWGLEAVAGGALLARSLNSAAILGHVGDAAGLPRLRTAAEALIPLAWCAGAVFLAVRLFPGSGLRSAGLALLVYFGALAPLWPRIIRYARS